MGWGGRWACRVTESEFAKVAAADLLADAEVGPHHEDARRRVGRRRRAALARPRTAGHRRTRRLHRSAHSGQSCQKQKTNKQTNKQ